MEILAAAWGTVEDGTSAGAAAAGFSFASIFSSPLFTPVNPMKAIERMPAMMSVMPGPRRGLGTSQCSSSSRMLAMMTIASRKPTPAKNE